MVPRIKGNPHLKKPPLYYWLGAASAKATGLSERVAARLPSVLCALLLLVETFWFCRLLGLSRLALPSVLVLACFYEFYSSGHGANFDMVLAATTFAAVIFFYRYQTTTEHLWLLAAGGAASLAFLAKATPAIPLIFVPIAAMLWQNGKLCLLRKPQVIALCILLPVATLLAWGGWMLLRIPNAWDVFRSEGLVPFGKAVKGSAAHNENPAFFFYKIFKIAAPASLLLPLLVVHWVRTRCPEERVGPPALDAYRFPDGGSDHLHRAAEAGSLHASSAPLLRHLDGRSGSEHARQCSARPVPPDGDNPVGRDSAGSRRGGFLSTSTPSSKASSPPS